MTTKSTPPAPSRSSKILQWGAATVLFVGIMAASGSGNQQRATPTPESASSSTPEIALPTAESTPPTDPPTSAGSIVMPTFRPAATLIPSATPAASPTSAQSSSPATLDERFAETLSNLAVVEMASIVRMASGQLMIYAELRPAEGADLKALAQAVMDEGLALAQVEAATTAVLFFGSECFSYDFITASNDWAVTKLTCPEQLAATVQAAQAATANAAAPALLPTSGASQYTCNCSKLCSAITTCEEARFQLSQCGCAERDSDGDGVPCESLCPGG